jgi:hypothetical protein
MGILGQVVPGLRDLRGPLAAGFVWVAIAVWLWGDRVVEPERLPTAELRRTYDWILTWPDAVRFGILTFVAYVLGMLSVTATNSLRARAAAVWSGAARRRARRGRAMPQPFNWPCQTLESELHGAA